MAVDASYLTHGPTIPLSGQTLSPRSIRPLVERDHGLKVCFCPVTSSGTSETNWTDRQPHIAARSDALLTPVS